MQFQKDKIHVNPMILCTGLLVLVERKDDMKEGFKYELTPIPPSLFEHGMMRKPNKSALGRAIKQDVSVVTPPVSSFHVLDRGVLSEVSSSSIMCSLSMASMVYLVWHFDGYENGPYIKDHEHKRRVGEISASVTVTLQNTPTCNQEVFLKDSKNKSQFISLLTKALKDESHDVLQSIGDADTQIALPALEYASKENKRPVTVAANGTDILVLLMFHWEAHMNICMLSHAGKKQYEC